MNLYNLGKRSSKYEGFIFTLAEETLVIYA